MQHTVILLAKVDLDTEVYFTTVDATFGGQAHLKVLRGLGSDYKDIIDRIKRLGGRDVHHIIERKGWSTRGKDSFVAFRRKCVGRLTSGEIHILGG